MDRDRRGTALQQTNQLSTERFGSHCECFRPILLNAKQWSEFPACALEHCWKCVLEQLDVHAQFTLIRKFLKFNGTHPA
ncbi:hypothetical protein scyTo_0016473 [Scyliorhinus torazame]|uniref:Uncharacterized protein n=1 Tax=Scyliorhinus torazame TaxID=75743 RepID=A0A401PRM9_SCYTO|nr:hypothetical protein [Scyliorhinus torazame]